MRQYTKELSKQPDATEYAPVMVAFHLYKKCFSIRNGVTKKVVGYTDSILLREVVFRVNRSGRERVLRERVKNVHAYVTGVRVDMDPEIPPELMRQWPQARYNPYVTDSFVDKLTGARVTEATYAWCESGKVYYFIPKSVT